MGFVESLLGLCISVEAFTVESNVLVAIVALVLVNKSHDVTEFVCNDNFALVHSVCALTQVKLVAILILSVSYLVRLWHVADSCPIAVRIRTWLLLYHQGAMKYSRVPEVGILVPAGRKRAIPAVLAETSESNSGA